MSGAISETGMNALGEVWARLMFGQRRALLALAGLPARLDECTWFELTSAQRLLLLQAFQSAGELATMAENALDRQRAAQFIG